LQIKSGFGLNKKNDFLYQYVVHMNQYLLFLLQSKAALTPSQYALEMDGCNKVISMIWYQESKTLRQYESNISPEFVFE